MTTIEKHKIYEEMKREYQKEDLENKLRELYPDEADSLLDEKTFIDEVLRTYNQGIENDDSWVYMLESSIKSVIKDKMA